MWNAGLDEAQAGIKIDGTNINNLRYADDRHHPYGRKWRETKEPLDEGEKGEYKSWLKTQHPTTKIMPSSPIISKQISGEAMEMVTKLFSLAPKLLQMVTAAMKLKEACSLERKLWKTQTCPLSQWCHPTISPSVAPFSFCPQFPQHQNLFPLSKLQEIVKGRETWHAVVHGLQRDATEWLNNSQAYKRKKNSFANWVFLQTYNFKQATFYNQLYLSCCISSFIETRVGKTWVGKLEENARSYSTMKVKVKLLSCVRLF